MSGAGDEILYVELVKDLRRRSHPAFEKVFREMELKVYCFALTYLMNADMADDVVRDTFVRFWTALNTLSENTRVSTTGMLP